MIQSSLAGREFTRVVFCLEGGSQGEPRLSFIGDQSPGERFNVLGVDGPVRADIYAYRGHVWYKWVWCWESTDEADAAWDQVPPTLHPEKILDELVEEALKVVQRHTDLLKDGVPIVLDVTPLLDRLGWRRFGSYLSKGDLDRAYDTAIRERSDRAR